MNAQQLEQLHKETPEGMFVNYSGQLDPSNPYEYNARKYIMGLDAITQAYDLYERLEKEGQPPTQFEYMKAYSSLYITHMKRINGVERLTGTSWGNSEARNWNDLNEAEKEAFRKFIRFRALNAWTGKEIERRAVNTLTRMKGEQIAEYTITGVKTDVYIDRIFGADIVITLEKEKEDASAPLLYIGITSEKSNNNYTTKKHTKKRGYSPYTDGDIYYSRNTSNRSRIFFTYSKASHSHAPSYTVHPLPLIKKHHIIKGIAKELKQFEENPVGYETTDYCPDFQNFRHFYRMTDNGQTLNYSA